MLPAAAIGDLSEHLTRLHDLYEDLDCGSGWVEMPEALGRKLPHAGRERPWPWVFPATRVCRHPETDQPTTMVYTHVLNRGGLGARSPMDFLDPAGP